MNLLAVTIGGFIGSILRYFLSISMNKRLIGTWIANITGSVFLAILFYFHSIHMLSDFAWLFLGVGLCGAYTTFSTFGNETIQLILQKRYKHATSYVFLSVSISLIAVIFTLHLLGY
ncbi:fluoride efflux transporter CrcB [Ornithinibacillus xuwenensis]|uniref:Fluoride-specific ion channel FluC n=1 Tax=Ornithinibacillus xuwenensis TaxID=3144668 RepID=A0ABU9XJB5_9BACI